MAQRNILIALFLLFGQYAIISNGYVINACKKIKCEKNDEIACLEIRSDQEGTRYECQCAKECKNLSFIKGPIVRTVPPIVLTENSNSTEDQFVHHGAPLAKQGGPSCYPSACMNGGTCYTNYNPSYSTTTTTTTTSAYKPPICSCQPQFSGSRCELYNPTPSPADGWNNLCRVYNDRNMNICQNGGQCVFIADGKVACVCPSTFTGQYCELPVYVQCQGPINAQCHRDYGTCGLDGSCICRTGYCGPKCDQRNMQQPTQPNQPVQPNPSYPQYQTNPSFQTNSPTNPPYQQYQTNPTFPTIPPIQTNPPYQQYQTNPPYQPNPYQPYQSNPPTNCQNYCLNGGSCRSFATEPYIICLCPPSYTGNRCETLASFTQNNYFVTMGPYSTNTQSPSTLIPRCNITISLQNDGLYTARFRVQYTIDGIQQPLYISPSLPFIGNTASVTIPYFAKDVVVSLERLGFQWAGIVQDSNINTATQCTKCYKTWGVVSDPKWDYLEC